MYAPCSARTVGGGLDVERSMCITRSRGSGSSWVWVVDCCAAEMMIKKEILWGERRGVGVVWRERLTGSP